MKLRVGLLAMAIVCGSASADLSRLAGEFEGAGVWKMPDGSKGKYTTVTSISKKERGIVVKEKLTIETPKGEHVEEFEWTATPTKNGFFDVSYGDVKAGSGVCFRHHCMLESNGKTEGAKMGEVFKFAGRRIYRSGYDVSEKEGMVAWQGVMKAKKN